MTSVALPSDVVDWRLKHLLTQYTIENAERIANSDIDYRYAIDLHQKCIDEKLCMKILFGK